MKLHTFPGAPNPLRVDLLIAEKGIDIETAKVDLLAKEQLTPEYRKKNPACDVPMLELDDGTCISQVPAILIYLEQRFPEPALYGGSPEAMAVVMMWEHLMANNGMGAVNEVLRNTSKSMVGRAMVGPHGYEQIPALAERGRLRTRNFFADLNERLTASEYVAGDFFSVADITAWASVNFGRWVKELPGEEHQALLAWYQKLEQRPTFQKVLEANKK